MIVIGLLLLMLPIPSLFADGSDIRIDWGGNGSKNADLSNCSQGILALDLKSCRLWEHYQCNSICFL
ncbi:MAG: hypothetical protein U5N58_06715 [Actinomycetota bacterium]|nr:hypothetical protein [Actinomycetota bacterium]